MWLPRGLVAVGLTGEFGGMGDVFAGLIAAEARGGEDFGGVGEIERVEGAADALHGGEIGFGEHFGHVLLFVFTDAMLAGDGAAGGDAEIEDFGGESLRGDLLAGDALIVEDEWVEVAVASVKDVGDAKAGSFAEGIDFAEDFG